MLNILRRSLNPLLVELEQIQRYSAYDMAVDIKKKEHVQVLHYDGRITPRAFSDWLASLNTYRWYDMTDEGVQFAVMKLVAQAQISWKDVKVYEQAEKELKIDADILHVSSRNCDLNFSLVTRGRAKQGATMAGKDTSVGASDVAEENVVVERRRDPLPPTGGKKGGRGQSKSRDALASLDGRTGHLEIAMGDVKDHVGMVEQNLQKLEDHVLEELESLKRAVGAQDELRERFTELFNSLQEQLDVVKRAALGKGLLPQGKMAALIEEKEKAECETVRIGSIQGATHNFITMEEAERLGLNVVDGGGWLKPVNAKAKPLQGTVRRVKMCLGKWKGFVNFSVAPIDDFKVVLGLDFLRQVNALVSPYNNAVCIIERGMTCVVPMFGGTSSTMTSMRLSGMRLVQEVEREEAKKSEGTYLASLMVEDRVVPMTEQQPKVDGEGKLDRGAKPQNAAPCGMAPPKEKKLSTTSKAKGEIIKLIKKGLHRDPLAKELLQLTKSGKTQRYRVKGDLLYTRDGRVYVPKWRDLRKMVIRESHDTQSTVHPGHRRSYSLVTTTYFWPQMKKEVQMCVETYHVCRQVKGASQADEAKLLDVSQVLHDLQRHRGQVRAWG
ncbi:hypothetical protein RJ640_022295 [Escallonia rubra]|uniref:Integrase zinc-binding domain-containing protein n=1 Tax=Escallonia rubra TaxID=112253 RepID=A0AA88QE13_9ASTE|nr:hypothetical protein RJ640_022295 [Escallonia rubra]